MFNEEVISCIRESVLLWLATSSTANEPNVSPKEVFTFLDNDNLLIANIASPQSEKNIIANSSVAISMVNIWLQKGFQFKGKAEVIFPIDKLYHTYLPLMEEITKGKFPIQSIFKVEVVKIKPIIAPSYLFFKGEKEKDKIADAEKSYFAILEKNKNEYP